MHIVDTQLKFCDIYVNDSWNRSTIYTMVPLEVQDLVQKIVLHEEVVIHLGLIPFGLLHNKICF